MIAVLTTGRQDWGILRSVCAAIRAEPALRLLLVAGGMHLSARHGRTVDALVADGFTPDATLDWVADDAPADVQAGIALERTGAWLREASPDALVLVGDRFETAAAALAATVDGVPIVHLHGGEETRGAFDDALRHAVTKLAHLHLVSHEVHRRGVIALGEDPATVHVIGAPGLDNLFREDLPDREELVRDLGLGLDPPLVIVTVHPATLDADPEAAAHAVAAAMDAVPATYVVTLPNVDPGSDAVATRMIAAGQAARRVVVPALGERRYWGLLRIADAVLGNSSSGVIEAPADGPAVAAALRRALEPASRDEARAARPPLADGRAGERAARMIAAWHPARPPRKAPLPVDR
jgi:UDP-N-acetylglucosamine 2-epimerase (non-hydrolysing)